MIKIIDLDIDGTLTGDTRVEEIALVQMPAIEQDFIYFTQQEFVDSITDYPQYITDTAKRAKKWVDENGYGNCMTPVGKSRLNQLANREPVSIETLKRMKAFGTRHKKDWDSSKSFDEGCGYLAMASWGFEPSTYDSVMNYLERIITKQENMDYAPTLPGYVNYPSGNTNNDMLIEPVLFVERNPGEDRSEYINRCTEYLIKNEGKQPDQAYAICNSTADEYSIGQNVSFDYDDTLNTPRGRGLALYELQSGSNVYIISARNSKTGMYPIADELGIPHDKVFATGSNKAKIQKIKDLRIDKHYDNNEDVINSLGIIGVQFMCPCLDEFADISDDVNLDVYGYTTKYFQICPGAQATFKELTSYQNDDDTIGMIRSAAVVADSIFKIEDDVLKASNASQSQLNEAIVLVDDFKDIINEIQKIQGKTYNVSYMDNHIKTIASYVGKNNKEQGFTMIGFIDGEPVFTTPEEAELYGETQHGCSGHHTHTDEDGNVVYMGCEIHPEQMEQEFSVEDYSDEEIEVIKNLYFLKENDYQQFEAVIGAMRGSTEQEIKRRNHRNPTNYFKYERILSGSPDRDFCTSIENRYFRRLEIDLLRDVNTEFGHERQPYSKWLYKGGPNCVHAWRKFIAQGDVLSDQGMATGTAGIPPKQLPNNGYYSPETKRKSEVAYIISQQGMSKMGFKADDEKRMVYSPLMIPNILIPRLSDDGEKYFVKFTPKVIEKIQNLYMIEKRLDKTNYEHTENKIDSVVMVESWIVSGNSDKAFQLGFSRENIPDGTWMGGFKVLDTKEGDYIWNEFIKKGKVKGFSVEGNFIMNFSRQKNDEYLLQEIINIIKQIND